MYIIGTHILYMLTKLLGVYYCVGRAREVIFFFFFYRVILYYSLVRTPIVHTRYVMVLRSKQASL